MLGVKTLIDKNIRSIAAVDWRQNQRRLADISWRRLLHIRSTLRCLSRVLLPVRARRSEQPSRSWAVTGGVTQSPFVVVVVDPTVNEVEDTRSLVYIIISIYRLCTVS